MVAPFPHHYTVSVNRTGPGRAELDAPPRPTLQGGPPPEFGGVAETWSPEHLLLSAVGLCLETTFDGLARRDGLVVERVRVAMRGDVDRTAAGLAFTSITANLEIVTDEASVERARAVVNRARHCLVSASLRVPVDVVATVTAVDTARMSA